MVFWNILNTPGLRYIEVGQCPRFYFREITVKSLNGDAVRLSYERQSDAPTSWREAISAMRKENGC
jgi:hypothetical protein